MLKTVAAGAAVFMLVAGAVAHAQQPQGGQEGWRGHFAEDRAAFLNARVAALHAGLQLTPEQEKAWPGFEKAYRDLAELRHRRLFGPHAEENVNPVQRAQRRADALTARGAALKQYAEALAPLYQSMDDGQKRRFGFLVRVGHHPHFHHFGGWRHEREFGERERERDGFRGPRDEFRDRGEL